MESGIIFFTELSPLEQASLSGGANVESVGGAGGSAIGGSGETVIGSPGESGTVVVSSELSQADERQINRLLELIREFN